MSSGNLAGVLEAAAEAGGWGRRTAFCIGDTVLAHEDVHRRGARAASVLVETGVGRGDAVLIALADGAEFVAAFLGAVRIGAIAVPVNPRLTVDDHRALAEDCRARVVVCGREVADRFPGRTVLTDRELAAALPAQSPHPALDVDPGTPAYVQYTSGTTGTPKGAVHRHGDPPVYHQSFAVGAIAMAADDVVLSVSKMYFAYGLGNSLFFPLLAGASAVLHADRPAAAEVARLASRHGVTLLFAVPTFYAGLVAAGQAPAFRSVRAAVSAGETLTTGLAGRVEAFLGCAVLDGLGSTEVGHTFTSNTVAARRPGTVGRALPPYRVAVRSDDGRDLPAGEVGTLWVQGPTVLVEYLGKPDETAAVKQGAWLRTGDRASLDADGFLHLHGRTDDMEMVSGISVAPQEIEDVLSRHQRVSEVAVAAVRDEAGASALRAFVVPVPPEGERRALAAELVELARGGLAPFKVPKAVVFVDALPRTPTGKLRRFLLRAGWAGSAE